MTDEKFFRLYDETKPKWEWFVKRYFAPVTLLDLDRLRKEKKRKELENELESIWFILPDHKFNIRENPPGWSEFLSLIDN